jgi:hypothetical protein
VRYLTLVSLIISFGLMGSLEANPKRYKTYPYDGSPFQKHTDITAEWESNRLAWKNKVAPQPVMKRQLEILEALSKREPRWIDGYWLVADAAFQLGNSYDDPKDYPIANAAFEKGKQSAEACLRIQNDNPLCKFYLGVNLGKIASIKGIFASLKNAKMVEKLWTEVTESPYNHQLSERSSLQGASRYALGLFYRLVPDFMLMKWLFGTKGDIEKSVAYHRENLAFDEPNVCSRTMLGVALVCSGDSDFSSKNGQEGLGQLKAAKSYPVTSALFASCAKDLDRLIADPKMSCGYETTRQQETSEEDFKKQNREASLSR